MNLLNDHRRSFSVNMTELGCSNSSEMEIIETSGTNPLQLPPIRVSASEREQMNRTINEWKRLGVVTDTKSPYSSPAILVKKKNGEKRLVIDFRALNALTVKQSYQLPDVDKQLEHLAGSRIFALLDMANGYLQVSLVPKNQEKTAFVTPVDSGELIRMVFGLMNAPYVFGRLIHKVLEELKNKVALVYVDDIIIPDRDFKDLLERLKKVLKALEASGLTLNPEKCLFGALEVVYLGFRISTDGIRPGLQKVDTVRNFPEPGNIHDIRRFFGLTGFFRRFIPNYAAFEVIHADHLGPFIKSRRGRTHLLVVIDNFTYYTLLSPAKDTTTRGVIKVLETIFKERGIPKRLITDRGSTFTAKIFEVFCDKYGVRHTLNLPRHPQGNGMVEQVNRVLIPMLPSTINDRQEDRWDERILEVERHLNLAKSKTTGRSPYEVLHGY